MGGGLWLIPRLSLSAHSHLPYNVTPEQALSHPEVQRRLDISLRSLLAVTDKFLVAIISSVDQIPYVQQPHPTPPRPGRDGKSRTVLKGWGWGRTKGCGWGYLRASRRCMERVHGYPARDWNTDAGLHVAGRTSLQPERKHRVVTGTYYCLRANGAGGRVGLSSPQSQK